MVTYIFQEFPTSMMVELDSWLGTLLVCDQRVKPVVPNLESRDKSKLNALNTHINLLHHSILIGNISHTKPLDVNASL